MKSHPTSQRSKFWWLVLLGALPLGALGIPCLLGVLVRLGADAEPQVIIDRKEWPPELEELVAKSNLTPEDIASIEVVRVGLGAGWFCRLRQTPGTTALVTSQWIPIEKSPVGASAQERFFGYLPNPWRKPAPAGRFYIHREYSTQEEGNGTAYLGLIDEGGEYVFVWFYFNF